LPKSFQSALHGVLTSSEYVAGVRATFQAGGCNASRASFIGACLGAKGGLDAIPESWKQKTLCFSQAKEHVEKIL